MAKVPFTPEGVRLKTQQLYALTQSELDAQARRAATDFKSWMSEEFLLNSKESQFIASISGQFINILSEEVSAALQSRLPIELEEPYPPKDGTGSKRVKLRRAYDSIYQGGQTSQTRGALFIAIDYVLS